MVMLLSEDSIYAHAIYLLISSCARMCVCGQDAEDTRIYCLSVASSALGSLVHTILCFPLINHCFSAVHILCVTPS